MNSKIKDYLGVVGIVALLVVSLGYLKYAGAYADSVPAGATFTAQGEGKVTAIPDVAMFSFGITTEGGKDIPKIQEENTEKANAAIDYVKSKGVDKADITTEYYDIQPRYENYTCPPVIYSAPDMPGRPTPSIAPQPCKNPAIIGYTISQTVRVKIRDFSLIGDILSGVTEKGANNVSGLSFTVNDIEKLRSEAKAKALAKAKEHAAEMARAGKFRLGRLVGVQEGGYNPYYANRNLEVKGMGGAAMDAAAPAPMIEPGSQEIVENVTLTYELR